MAARPGEPNQKPVDRWMTNLAISQTYSAQIVPRTPGPGVVFRDSTSEKFDPTITITSVALALS